jgi:hypothetical protein
LQGNIQHFPGTLCDYFTHCRHLKPRRAPVPLRIAYAG